MDRRIIDGLDCFKWHIDFSNVHLFAETLTEDNYDLAKALYEELEVQTRAKEMSEDSDMFGAMKNIFEPYMEK